MSALTNKQKATLVGLARRAFQREGAIARGRGLQPAPVASAASIQEALALLALDGGNQAFEEWRHEQVAIAVGKAGLRCCSQEDYKTVEAHFLKLIGEEGKALKAYVRGQCNPERVARWKLDQALQHWGFDQAYAAALCRNIHKTDLPSASAKIIWNLVYTVNNRGRRRKQAAAFYKAEEAAV